ncbi:hypothetical protein [Novosphingobium sp.]|uniref:hypothetical protein n=1 Tax=Novosphingobium sp. TaxID=1874826 RepID=UPI00334149BD
MNPLSLPMQTAALFGWISAALLAQVLLGVAVAVVRARARVRAVVVPGWFARLRSSLISREVIPFYVSLAMLGVTALAVDAVLHLAGLVWIGRYLGIVGVAMILFSFRYSLRKHKLITVGNPIKLLRLHERLAWAGSMLVLVHAGIHFNAILAWLAVLAMVINFASGLTGKYLLGRARKRLEANRATLAALGVAPDRFDEHSFWDTLAYAAVRQWRAIHLPITLAFGVLALSHVIATFLFWNWA